MTEKTPLLVADGLDAGYLPGINILNDCSPRLFEGELAGNSCEGNVWSRQHS